MFYGRLLGKHLRGISSMTDMTGMPNLNIEQLRPGAAQIPRPAQIVSASSSRLSLPQNEE
jgi:hypothetical protein